MCTDPSELLTHIENLHTTEMGVMRMQKNLSMPGADVVCWCKNAIRSPLARIVRKGKNWYVDLSDCIITVNAHSYTIITAHKKK